MCCAIALLSMFAVPGGAPQSDRYLDGANGAWKWIESQAVSSADGTVWPKGPGLSPSYSLYSGTPGALLFLAALHQATGDSQYLTILQDDLKALYKGGALHGEGLDSAGLYTGLAGLGALGLWLKDAGEDQLGESLVAEVLTLLLESAKTTKDGMHWGEGTDVISGASGVGFFLLAVSSRTKDDAAKRRALDAARQVGDWLIAQGEAAGHGALKWRIDKEVEKVYPNFSHGTAGVACFLSELYRATSEKEFLDVALQGAAYLESIAVKEEKTICWYHHEGDGEDLYYAGWCHGPPGTARMYFSLYKATGAEKWMKRVTECANWVIENAQADKLEDGTGYWNPSVCCGVAGVGDFLLDVYLVTGEKRYLDNAKLMAGYVLGVAEGENEGLKWTQAEHRVRPDEKFAQTGYMQGAAGIGLFLLKTHMVESGVKRIPWSLPDNPFAN